MEYNRFPDEDYDSVNPFSVNDNKHFNNEIKFLKLLEKYNITPKILENNENSLILSNCGEQLSNQNLPSDWKKQIKDIYNILKTERIYHNDIKLENLTVKDNKIYIIDFGWASQDIPSYPYFNLAEDIIDKSETLNEIFHKIYNDASSRVLNIGVNLNNYINSERKF